MVIVLMGVSGSGKSTIGPKLAAALGCPFYDGDDYHSREAKEKMGRGTALTDEDRAPWLRTLAGEMKKWEAKGPLSILACSALKQKYRAQLSQEVPVQWIHLKGDKALIRSRLEARQGHFAKDLLESQFEALEEPKEAMVIDISADPGKIVDELVKKLRERRNG